VSSDAPRPGDGYTAAQVRAAEAPLLAAGEPLMRRAASALAAEITRLLQGPADAAGPAAEGAMEAAGQQLPGATDAAGPATAGATDAASRPLVVVLAGSGDNGGDALYAGAELAAAGTEVRIVATGPRVHEDAAAAARAAGATDLDPDAEPDGFDRAILAADVLVDGILGIGAAASPALRGRARELVQRIRARLEEAPATRHPLVVAVDLPSGIGPDDGAVPDPAVLPADVTVTFGAVKAGLLLPPGSAHAGRVVLVDLGLGPALAAVEPAVRLRGGA
jgi:hydroxyethylthiazole kinase-like uncharacterized protein yjeF